MNKDILSIVKQYYDLNEWLLDSCYLGNLEVVKYLVSQGADIQVREGGYDDYDSDSDNYNSDYGDDYDYHDHGHDLLTISSEKGHIEIVKYLVSLGNYIGNNCSVLAASKFGHFEVVKYLVTHGADINDCYSKEFFRLIGKYGDVEFIKYLIENGLKIKKYDNEIFRLASRYGHLEVIKFIAEKTGEDVIVAVNSSNTMSMFNSKNNYSLYWAAKNGHLEVVKYLVENKCTIETYHNDSAIRLASYNGHLDIVKYLIDNKAYLSDYTRDNIIFDKKNKYTEVVKYLKTL